MTRHRKSTTLVAAGILLIAVSFLVAGNLAQDETPSRPAPAQKEVLFGAYSCVIETEFGVRIQTSFTSTGDLVSPAAAGAFSGGSFFAPTLRLTREYPMPTASVEVCDPLVASVEQLLTSTGCTAGSRESFPEAGFVAVQFVCEGSRNALAEVIGAMGRETLTAMLSGSAH